MGCFSMCFRSKQKKGNKNARLTKCYSSPISSERILATNSVLHLEDEGTNRNAIYDVGNLSKRRCNPKWAKRLISPAEAGPGFVDDSAQENAQQNDPFAQIGELAKELRDLTRVIQGNAENVKKSEDEREPSRAHSPAAAADQTEDRTHSSAAAYQSEDHPAVDNDTRDTQTASNTETSVASGEHFFAQEKEATASEDPQDRTKYRLVPADKSSRTNSTTFRTPSLSYESASTEHTDDTAAKNYSVTPSTSESYYVEIEEVFSDPEQGSENGRSYRGTDLRQGSFNTSGSQKFTQSLRSENVGSYVGTASGSDEFTQTLRTENGGSYTGTDRSQSNFTTSGSEEVTQSLPSENGKSYTVTSSNASKFSSSTIQRQSRYPDYESGEDEDYDSMLDGEESYASEDSSVKDSASELDEVSSAKQYPALLESTYSPHPTAELLPHGSKHSLPKPTSDNAIANNTTRVRAQYVYPVLNPVENLAQWNALKRDDVGSSEEFTEKKTSRLEKMCMAESMLMARYADVRPVTKQRTEARYQSKDHFPKTPSHHISSKPTVVPESKENYVAPMTKDIPTTKRKQIPMSEEPVFKEPKEPATRSKERATPEGTSPVGGMVVDASLSQWLSPSAENAANGEDRSSATSDEENLNTDACNRSPKSASKGVDIARVLREESEFRSPATPCPSDRSVMATGSVQMQHSEVGSSATPIVSPPMSLEDRPILGALSLENIKAAASNKVSPRKSPTSKDLDNRPILEASAYDWSSPSKKVAVAASTYSAKKYGEGFKNVGMKLSSKSSLKKALLQE